jgi:hypothetical protein
LPSGYWLGAGVAVCGLNPDPVYVGPATGTPIGDPIIAPATAIAVGEPDGRPVAFSGRDEGAIVVWDPATGAPVGARSPATPALSRRWRSVDAARFSKRQHGAASAVLRLGGCLVALLGAHDPAPPTPPRGP